MTQCISVTFRVLLIYIIKLTTLKKALPLFIFFKNRQYLYFISIWSAKIWRFILKFLLGVVILILFFFYILVYRCVFLCFCPHLLSTLGFWIKQAHGCMHIEKCVKFIDNPMLSTWRTDGSSNLSDRHCLLRSDLIL